MFPDLPLSFPMGGMDIAFYVVAFVILMTAVCCVAVKNILQSAVFLIFSFVTTAILYMLMHAEFIALAQVMVYVGGVVIFVVFTILLTSHLGEEAFCLRGRCRDFRGVYDSSYEPFGRRRLLDKDAANFYRICAFHRVCIRDGQMRATDSGLGKRHRELPRRLFFTPKLRLALAR